MCITKNPCHVTRGVIAVSVIENVICFGVMWGKLTLGLVSLQNYRTLPHEVGISNQEVAVNTAGRRWYIRWLSR